MSTPEPPTARSGGVSSEEETITPEIAETWLNRAGLNRRLRNRLVTEIAAAIERGEWVLNGETIKFDRDGMVIDGQHRLWAVIEAGIPVRSLVVRGLPPEAQVTVDVGAKRTLSDQLMMQGEVNCMNLAATLNRLHLWRQGEAALRNPNSYRLSIPQALEMLKREPGVREALRRALIVRYHLNCAVSASTVAACLYVFEDIDRADSDEFWRRVGTGEMVQQSDPCYLLRRAIQRNAMDKRKMTSTALHAVIIKAWNAYREGTVVRTLSFKVGGSKPEAFPEAV